MCDLFNGRPLIISFLNPRSLRYNPVSLHEFLFLNFKEHAIACILTPVPKYYIITKKKRLH